jgi:hypothetical protein
MPKCITLLPPSEGYSGISIIEGILTSRNEDGIRCIPFTKEGKRIGRESVLFSTLHKPKVDSFDYIYEVFYDKATDTLQKEYTESSNDLSILLIREVLFFRVEPAVGTLIRNVRSSRTRDGLVIAYRGSKITLRYPNFREISFQLQF